MKSNYILLLFLNMLIISIFINNSFAQVAQAFERFTPGSPSKVEDSWDRNDPNIIYWNSYVKQNQLAVLGFNMNSLPLELFSYGDQVNQQYDNLHFPQWFSEIRQLLTNEVDSR